MVVILFVLALPENPLNLITRVAVGTAGMDQWIIPGMTAIVAFALGYVTHWYAGKSRRDRYTT